MIELNPAIVFADDILICANIPHELKQMLHELADESENQRLKMNKSKTKVMVENDTPIYVNNTQIEKVDSYIYLGQRYRTKTRRIAAGWTAFAKHHESSRVILDHAWRDNSTIHAYFQQ